MASALTGGFATRSFLRDCRGAIAAETALVSGFLVVLIAQVLDFGWFAYCSVQVRMAAQAAAAESAVVCTQDFMLPATVNCGSGLKSKMQTAANEVSIGGAITIADADLKEAYYCPDPDSNNALVKVGEVTDDPKPADCTAVGSPKDTPGDFVHVTVTYTFTPLFPGLSAISYSGNTMKSEGWMRVG